MNIKDFDRRWIMVFHRYTDDTLVVGGIEARSRAFDICAHSRYPVIPPVINHLRISDDREETRKNPSIVSGFLSPSFPTSPSRSTGLVNARLNGILSSVCYR